MCSPRTTPSPMTLFAPTKQYGPTCAPLRITAPASTVAVESITAPSSTTALVSTPGSGCSCGKMIWRAYANQAYGLRVMTTIRSGSFSPQMACLSSSVKTKAVALQAAAASRYLLLAKKATSPCPAVSSGAMDLISALPPLALIVLNKVSLLFSLIRSTNSRRVIGAVC
ncbi:unknown [Proteobacteria bacterium CAG:139]|nr:unknown [Proteobacteria bacterium CAG:139]